MRANESMVPLSRPRPFDQTQDDIFGDVIADFENHAPGRCSHGCPVCMEYANGNIVTFYQYERPQSIAGKHNAEIGLEGPLRH